MLFSLNNNVRQYMVVTFNYWNFTLTDGALRMLVVLYFHDLGYSGLAVASLFLFYEFFGVVTNLVGGWFGACFGLNRTMNIGLAMQIVALGMLALPSTWLTLTWVMMAQALSGIAKDLNKMSAKSAIKTLVANDPQNVQQSNDQQSTLYRWVAILTGSKNALKGMGFFLGGVLLSLVGFQHAMLLMATVLTLVLMSSLVWLDDDIGKAKSKPKFKQLLSKSTSINTLSAARLFLFGARDVWFVVALPIYLGSVFGWDHLWVGGFLACWVMAYGMVQGIAPKVTGTSPDGASAWYWALVLVGMMGAMAYAIQVNWQPQWVIVIGLLLFGAAFAVNSSLHSYLIVSYASGDGVSLDVGFYYMANAMGRLIGTIFSGWVYQMWGFAACLWIALVFLVFTALISLHLPQKIQGNA